MKYTYTYQEGSHVSSTIYIHDIPGYYNHSPAHIFDGIVEHCCKALSLNEMRELVEYADRFWLPSRKINKMIQQIKQVIAKREKQTSYRPRLSVRYDRGSIRGLRIKFFGSNREKWISNDCLEYCLNSFTANELAEVVRQYDKQLAKLSSDDISPNQAKMLEGLKKAQVLRSANTSDFSAKQTNIRAELKRQLGAGAAIKVTGLPGEEELYGGIVEHCGLELSTNELREILKQVYAQLDKMEVDDIPLTFLEVLTELEKALKARK